LASPDIAYCISLIAFLINKGPFISVTKIQKTTATL